MLYHIDGSGLRVVKYAMAHINKYMEARVGSDKIDIKVVVLGPVLKLFVKLCIDPILKKKLAMNIDKYMQPEISQVLMKVFNKPLESLALDFVLTEHPLEIEVIKLEKIWE